MINPAPIPSELSLNAGGSRKTEDLPQNSLNSFTNRSKVEEQKRRIHAFKGKIRLDVMGHWSGCGGVLHGSWKRFHLARMRLQFCHEFDLNFASKRGPIVARSGHDWATIRPRSSINRCPGSRSAAI